MKSYVNASRNASGYIEIIFINYNINDGSSTYFITTYFIYNLGVRFRNFEEICSKKNPLKFLYKFDEFMPTLIGLCKCYKENSVAYAILRLFPF